MSNQAVAGAPRLKGQYRSSVVNSLTEEFKFENPMMVPRLEKITINMGLGEAVGNPNIVKGAVDELTRIAGQRAVATRAKKSIAGFSCARHADWYGDTRGDRREFPTVWYLRTSTCSRLQRRFASRLMAAVITTSGSKSS